ncbi:MAG: PKD domain-containing protein [Thermodesulfobacteriota bacterium]|nr:PKD domain-containing protein [Thermodesulfobacteriota bacterium]
MFKKTIILLFGLFLFSSILSSAHAGDVVLSWSASSGDVTGYKIYYGTNPGDYTNNIDVGNVTQYQISGLQEGNTYYFVARAYNDSGESDNSNEISWAWSPVDTEPPTVLITSPTSNAAYETHESTISLSGSASDNVGISQVLWSNATAGSGGTATGTESWSVSSIALSKGNNTITVTANDASDNQGSSTIIVTYIASVPDTTPPSGSISINDGAAYTKTIDVTLTLFASDAESGMGTGAHMKISNDGTNWTAPLPYSESMSYNLPPGDGTGDGTKTVFANFSDAAGNWMGSPVNDQIDYAPNQPPVAIASGTPPTGESPLSVSFNGSGTDSDGSVVAYAWGFGDGTTSSAQNPSHTYSAAGTYTATLTVTDDDGDTGNATVSISVYAPNQPPVAIASGNFESGEAPLSVSFNGSGTDSDGSVVAYAWGFGDGTTSSAQNPSHTYNTAGTYTATFTVTDDDGATGNETVSITVYAPNQLPVATASGTPLSGETPLSVSFNGSGTDSDGSILAYAWDFGDGATSSAQNPSHTYNAVGTYTATLTVKDDDGSTATKSLTISVSAPLPAAVEDIIIDNGDPETNYKGRWRESRDINYYGTKSQYAQYGNATYSWNAGFVRPGTYNVYMRWAYLFWSNKAVPVEITHSGGISKVTVNQRLNIGKWVLLGTYNFGTTGTVKVIHTSGYRTTSVDAVKFVGVDTGAVPSNNKPVASATGTPLSGEAPLSVLFNGSGTDSDGSIVEYAWDFGDGATSSAQNPSHTYSSDGTYTTTLTVTDNDGATRNATVSISVSEKTQYSPTAEISLDKSTGTAPLIVNFSGAGSDIDGYISFFNWDFGDGTTSSSQNPSHTYSAAGTYTATLTVTDDDGATGNATVSITGYAPNQLPVASASGTPLSGEAPLSVLFNGSGTDSDGSILAYAWDFGDGATSSAQNPPHTYNTAGSYTAILTVTDDDGSTATKNLTISVSAPSPAVMEDIIIDNGDPETSYTGRWRESRDANYYGTKSQYAQYGNATYSWNAGFVRPGTYNVYMRWAYLFWSNKAVPVEITHSGGISKVTVNQRLNIGKWVLLGTYNFGTTGTVKVIHTSGYRTTSVDAVKFVGVK